MLNMYLLVSVSGDQRSTIPHTPPAGLLGHRDQDVYEVGHRMLCKPNYVFEHLYIQGWL